MQVVVLLLSLLLGTYFVLNSATSHKLKKIKITHYSATSNTVYLQWKKKIGDARLTKFKVAHIGWRNYHDQSNTVHAFVSHGESEVVTRDRVLLMNLTHCTKYSITISGWNDLATVTNKPMFIRTLTKVVEPNTPSVATQLRSDGHTHAIVTIYPSADNLGCKKYQLIVMVADNTTESRQWTASSLGEALTNEVDYIYIAAEFNDTEPMNTIELGDDEYYGSYLNKPLVPSTCYRLAIRIVFNKNSELNPTYSKFSPDQWCLRPLVPKSDAISGVNKSTALKSILISVGIMVFLFVLVFIGWVTLIICQKKGLFFYSDKVIKGPSLWDVVRGKKGPTILEQLISVDYRNNSAYDYLDEDVDLISSGISVVGEISENKTRIEHPNDDPGISPESSATSKISSEGPETSIEHLYDDPATDSS